MRGTLGAFDLGKRRDPRRQQRRPLHAPEERAQRARAAPRPRPNVLTLTPLSTRPASATGSAVGDAARAASRSRPRRRKQEAAAEVASRSRDGCGSRGPSSRRRAGRSRSRTSSTPRASSTTYGSIALRRPRAGAERRGGRCGSRRRATRVAGKTNLHEFAYGISSQNPHFGTVPNPRSPRPARGRLERRLGGGDRRRATSSSRSAPTPAARSGSRRRGAASSASSRRTTSSRPTAASRSRRATTTSGRWRRPSRAAPSCCGALAPGFEPASLDSLEELRVGVAWLDEADPLVRERASRRPPRASRAARRSTSRSPTAPRTRSSCARSPTSTAALFPEHADDYGESVRWKLELCLEVTDGEVVDGPAAARGATASAARRSSTGFDLLVTPTVAARRAARRRRRARAPRPRHPLHVPVRLPRLARARAAVRAGRGGPARLGAARRAARAPTPAFSRPARCSHPSFEGRQRPSVCRKRGMTVRFLRIAILLALRCLRRDRDAVVGRRRCARRACTASCSAPTSRDRRRSTARRRSRGTRSPARRTYQFQLSTSSTFRDNGILYSNASLTTPVAAPTLTLPWITGSPHALYARVRARHSTRRRPPWSAPFGFDVVAAAAAVAAAELPGPAPLDADRGRRRLPGLARRHRQDRSSSARTSSTSASSTPSISRQQWIGTVRWRIRALRGDVSSTSRINGIPVAQYGAWSPVYSSTNPAHGRRADHS